MAAGTYKVCMLPVRTAVWSETGVAVTLQVRPSRRWALSGPAPGPRRGFGSPLARFQAPRGPSAPGSRRGSLPPRRGPMIYSDETWNPKQ